MTFKLPEGRVVSPRVYMVQTSPAKLEPMPVTAVRGWSDTLFGPRNLLKDLLRRFQQLPTYLRARSKGASGLGDKQAALSVYDFLSEAATVFGFPDIRNGPDDFIRVEFVNLDDFNSPLEIKLLAKNARGNALLEELEQLETTVELQDWHK